ncbi:MAG: hypothetical protein QF463_08505 [Vicinamibacterales bacterium]|jgi:hypothetical protein|nr:hypothetical protein [Acidobacteriota bacterium]MDP6371622.1 hypothetical protein [Vicinamibacterales bacterium]MDP6609092.1 hypothetical protein [Vicinamibacterales bacterium]HAK56315.1 hypothetical protein [Acidobacteriota bacterium]|tara:strand:- start:4132 stop:4641 length:510 start_codon:yes stop_codon:yes gene_type:complete
MNALMPVALALLVSAPLSSAPEQEQEVEIGPTAVREFPTENIRLDVTINEIVGEVTTSRDIHMTVAEGRTGRIRSRANHIIPNRPTQSLPLAVDATPQLVENGKIFVELSLEISVLDPGTDEAEGQMVVSIADSLAVILEPGEPMVVAQSADTLSDLKVEVEVTASVQR